MGYKGLNKGWELYEIIGLIKRVKNLFLLSRSCGLFFSEYEIYFLNLSFVLVLLKAGCMLFYVLCEGRM